MLARPSGPRRKGETGWQGYCSGSRGDGKPVEPSSLSSAVPTWAPGEPIHFGHRTVRVVGVCDDEADEPPVLVVEDVA